MRFHFVDANGKQYWWKHLINPGAIPLLLCILPSFLSLFPCFLAVSVALAGHSSLANRTHTYALLPPPSQIVMDSPKAGQYTIVVSCVSIDTVEGPQSYSLVVSSMLLV